MLVLETSIYINVVIFIKLYEINGMLWTILRLSLASMLGYTHHIFDPISIPSEQVTKLPLKLFMLFRVPIQTTGLLSSGNSHGITHAPGLNVENIWIIHGFNTFHLPIFL